MQARYPERNTCKKKQVRVPIRHCLKLKFIFTEQRFIPIRKLASYGHSVDKSRFGVVKHGHVMAADRWLVQRSLNTAIYAISYVARVSSTLWPSGPRRWFQAPVFRDRRFEPCRCQCIEHAWWNWYTRSA